MNTSCFTLGMRRLRIAAASLALAATAQTASADVVYRYTGPVMTDNRYRSGQVYGYASFDESIVTADFTGTLGGAAFTARLNTFDVARSDTFFGTPLFVSFVDGQVVSWYVATQNPLFGGLIATSTGGDVLMAPLSAFYSSTGGSWVREGAPSPVPLPLPWPLLAAGLAGLGVAGRRKSG